MQCQNQIDRIHNYGAFVYHIVLDRNWLCKKVNPDFDRIFNPAVWPPSSPEKQDRESLVGVVDLTNQPSTPYTDPVYNNNNNPLTPTGRNVLRLHHLTENKL